MSTIMMSACWPLQGMSAPQKAVLISLADQANDDGVCWPSVASLCKRTCLSERAVRDALKWLESVGLIQRDFRANKTTSYTVTPDGFKPQKAEKESPQPAARGARRAPPAPDAPPARRAPPPAPDAPPEGHDVPPNRKGTIIEPSEEGKARARPPAYPKPDDVTEQTWADWLALRKAKRAAVSATVLDGARREARKAGLSLEAFLQEWCLRGSQGLKAEWLQQDRSAKQSTGETAYQRSMRERVAEACPSLARPAPMDDEAFFRANLPAADVIDVVARPIATKRLGNAPNRPSGEKTDAGEGVGGQAVQKRATGPQNRLEVSP